MHSRSFPKEISTGSTHQLIRSNPQKHQPGKWRLIVYLSHLSGNSMNDSIPKPLCSLSYITVDSAIAEIMKLGRGTLLAKVDIKNAFCLLPVHLADCHLLAMSWNTQIFIDNSLPFGLRSAPILFNILADLLSWILQQKGVDALLRQFSHHVTSKVVYMLQ